MVDERLIQAWSPKREWLLRCGGDEPKVCSIEVGQGTIEVWLPEGRDPLRLELSQIAEFREAFDQAVELAELDLRARKKD
ncbi:MAG: hypothetical protein ABIQ18_14690 [Umezawaea sp.]